MGQVAVCPEKLARKESSIAVNAEKPRGPEARRNVSMRPFSTIVRRTRGHISYWLGRDVFPVSFLFWKRQCSFATPWIITVSAVNFVCDLLLGQHCLPLLMNHNLRLCSEWNIVGELIVWHKLRKMLFLARSERD
jgi:hypothetical protein